MSDTSLGWQNDLSAALAIAFPIPAEFRDPLKDLSDTPAFVAYKQGWREDLEEFLSPALPQNIEIPNPRNYQVGPAAGPFTDMVFLVAQNLNAVIQAVDAYLGLGSALIGLARRRKERDNSETNSFWKRKTFFYGSPPVISAMCLAHAHENYYDPKTHPKMTVQLTARGEPMGSDTHPTKDVQYTVQVRIGSVSYIYIVTADCRVLDHFRISEHELSPLELPDWFEEIEDWESSRKMGTGDIYRVTD